MLSFFDVLVRGNKIVRDYLAATLLLVLAVFGGTQGVITLAEWAQTRDDAQIRAVATGQSRTYVVSRSVLDDDLTTASVVSGAAQTRLDPCALPERR